MTKLSRSDRTLLASAWRQVSGNPEVRFRKSTGPFRAQYGGFCGRCGREVETGQMIQCHKYFDGVVHIGCDAPEIVVRTVKTVAVTPPTRGAGAVAPQHPALCPDCHLQHAGACW